MLWQSITAVAVCTGLAASGCGVMSSSDCAARATCIEDRAGPTIDATSSDAVSRSDDGGPGEGGGAGSDVSADALDEAVADAPLGAIDECSPTEDCSNGVDDNCDGLIDCADPMCQPAYTCLPPVPAGWTGPAELWQAANPATPPGCRAGYGTPRDGQMGFAGPPATCGCSCAPTGQVCSAQATFHKQTDCSGDSVSVPAPDGICTPVPTNTLGSEGSFSVDSVPTPSGGRCDPKPTTMVLPVTWASSARVCSHAGPADSPGGCAAGDICVPAPGGDFATTACVFSTADPPPTSCPAGYDATGPTLFYSGDSDSRRCAPCSCGSGPTGGTCSGTIDLYGDLAAHCVGTPDKYTLGGAACACYGQAQCGGLTVLLNDPGYVMGSYAMTAGTCAQPPPPAAIGSATPTGPTTVCCSR